MLAINLLTGFLEEFLFQPRNIILVGFMASGKSQVGRILSRAIGWPLVDADDVIVQRAGKPIHKIFEREGEPTFRALERSVTADLCAGSGQIIAAGGGAFVDPENRHHMRENGLVFCLNARPDTVYRRITEADPNAAERPMLSGDDPEGRITALMEERAEAYSQAHHLIETDALTLEEVAQQILKLCPGIVATDQSHRREK